MASRISPSDHEEVEATRRLSMHQARRDRILKRQNGVCAYPGCEAPAEEIDHIVQLWLGGKDKDWNCEGLCVPHHKKKTADDAKLRAKTKRQKFKDETPREDWPSSGPKLKSRGFGQSRWSTVEEQGS